MLFEVSRSQKHARKGFYKTMESKLRNKYMETHTKVEFAIMEMLHLADTFSVKNGLVLSGIKNFVVVVVIVIVAGLSMLAFPLNIGGLANIN